MSISSLLSYLNPFAYFDSKPLLVEYEELSEPRWTVYGKEICIIRHGEDINYLIVDPITKEKLGQNYLNKRGCTADELIDRLKMCIPEITDGGIVDFKIGYESMIDGTQLINENNWAITMINSDPGTFWNPLTWKGHTVLLIEKLENGVYTMLKAHLISGGIRTGKVGLDAIINIKYLENIQEKTETWVRSAEKVQEMIKSIEREIETQDRGGVASRMNLSGGNLLNIAPKKIGNKLLPPNNCYTWARAKLHIVGIRLSTGLALLIHSPKSNIDPTAVSSKAAVYVAVEGIELIRKPINVTTYIHKKLGGKRSWQPLSSLRNTTCTINGRTFENINIVAKTSASIDTTISDFALNDMEQLHIGVKIRNEGIRYIDVSGYLYSYIFSYLKSKSRSVRIHASDDWDFTCD